MPTVSLDPHTYKLLKRVSKILKVPMSTIVRIALIKQIKSMIDEGIPPELELEMYYYELTELYNLVKMAERIQYWFERRLEILREKAEEADYTPVRTLLKNYVKRMEEVYKQLEESFKKKKATSIPVEAVDELAEIEEVKEYEIVEGEKQ